MWVPTRYMRWKVRQVMQGAVDNDSTEGIHVQARKAGSGGTARAQWWNAGPGGHMQHDVGQRAFLHS